MAEVARFLVAHGCRAYVSKFTQEEIDSDSLGLLTDEDLCEMGLDADARRRLLSGIAERDARASVALVPLEPVLFEQPWSEQPWSEPTWSDPYSEPTHYSEPPRYSSEPQSRNTYSEPASLEPACLEAAYSEAAASVSVRRKTGTVKWYHPQKRIGFIAPDEDPSSELFVHAQDIVDSTLVEGSRVEYELGEFRGRPKATHVVCFGAPVARSAAGSISFDTRRVALVAFLETRGLASEDFTQLLDDEQLTTQQLARLDENDLRQRGVSFGARTRFLLACCTGALRRAQDGGECPICRTKRVACRVDCRGEHGFCLDCITAWRSQTVKNARAGTTCPLCREIITELVDARTGEQVTQTEAVRGGGVWLCVAPSAGKRHARHSQLAQPAPGVPHSAGRSAAQGGSVMMTTGLLEPPRASWNSSAARQPQAADVVFAQEAAMRQREQQHCADEQREQQQQQAARKAVAYAGEPTLTFFLNMDPTARERLRASGLGLERLFEFALDGANSNSRPRQGPEGSVRVALFLGICATKLSRVFVDLDAAERAGFVHRGGHAPDQWVQLQPPTNRRRTR